MSRRANPTLVGTFVVAAVLVAIFSLLLLGGAALFHRTHDFVLFVDGDVNGLSVGAPVKFQGVRIGSVTSIRLRITPQGATPIMPVMISLDESLISSLNETRYSFEPERFRHSIEAGLRARIDAESFVTGQRYVALLLAPDTPVKLLGLMPELDEIPTLPATSQEIERLLDQLKNVRLDVLVDDFVQTSRAIRELVSSPEAKALPGAVGRSLDSIDAMVQTLQASVQRTDEVAAELERTLVAAQALMDPDAPLIVQLQTTLQEFGNTARSLRSLAELVERDPGALLRGKEIPSKP
jgi:paraquat-inducible protein B